LVSIRRAARRRTTVTTDSTEPSYSIGHGAGVTAPQPGIAVDALGGGVIDPTKNVEDLVRALEIALAEFRKSDIKYVDTQLVAAEKLQNYARDANSRLRELEVNAERRLRDALRSADAQLAGAETRRIDQLAQTRQEFQNTIRDMLAESVRTTSTLVSTQLVQIQATFDTRVSKLEAGAFTQAGKQSERDPQISDALLRISTGLSTLRTDTDTVVKQLAQANLEAISKITNSQMEQTAKLTAAIATIGKQEDSSTTQRMARVMTVQWFVAAAMLMASVATPTIAFFALRSH
jgi:hypothetical protein